MTGSLWSLLIYLMVNDEKTCRRTRYFFMPKGIHPSVRKNFPGHVVLNTSITNKLHWRVAQFLYIFIPYLNRLRWPFLLNADIWGIDQENEIQSIIGRNKYTLVEDGINDYIVDRRIEKHLKNSIRNILRGPCYRHDFGRNNHCKRIILTKQADPNRYNGKAQFVDLPTIWKESSDKKREFILSCFNLSLEALKEIASKKVILLTQPIASDCKIPEEEAMAIYKRLIEPYGEENILIKPHPRETTDYSSVIEKVFPFQLFNLVGMQFDAAITICSTAVSEFKDSDTKIVFAGTNIDSRIPPVYGNVTADNLIH